MNNRKKFLIAFAVALAALLLLLIYACYIFLRYYTDELVDPQYTLGVLVNGALLAAIANICSTISVPLLLFALIWFRLRESQSRRYWIAVPFILLFAFWLSGFQYPNANKKLYTYLWHVRMHEPEYRLMEPDSLIEGAHTKTYPELVEWREFMYQNMSDERKEMISRLDTMVSDEMLDSLCASEQGRQLQLDKSEFPRSKPVDSKQYSIEYYRQHLLFTLQTTDIYRQNALRCDIQIKFTWAYTILMALFFLMGRLIGRLTRSVHMGIIVPAVFLVLWFFVGSATLLMTNIAQTEKLSPMLSASIIPICISIVLAVLYFLEKRQQKKIQENSENPQ